MKAILSLFSLLVSTGLSAPSFFGENNLESSFQEPRGHRLPEGLYEISSHATPREERLVIGRSRHEDRSLNPKPIRNVHQDEQSHWYIRRSERDPDSYVLSIGKAPVTSIHNKVYAELINTHSSIEWIVNYHEQVDAFTIQSAQNGENWVVGPQYDDQVELADPRSQLHRNQLFRIEPINRRDSSLSKIQIDVNIQETSVNSHERPEFESPPHTGDELNPNQRYLITSFGLEQEGYYVGREPQSSIIVTLDDKRLMKENLFQVHRLENGEYILILEGSPVSNIKNTLHTVRPGQLVTIWNIVRHQGNLFSIEAGNGAGAWTVVRDGVSPVEVIPTNNLPSPRQLFRFKPIYNEFEQDL